MLALMGLLGACANRSASGTNDPILDAELREMQAHEEHLGLLAQQIDSLSCLVPRNSNQEEELIRALERQDWHQQQWEESSRRANARAQGQWNRICPVKRSPGVSCND